MEFNRKRCSDCCEKRRSNTRNPSSVCESTTIHQDRVGVPTPSIQRRALTPCSIDSSDSARFEAPVPCPSLNLGWGTTTQQSCSICQYRFLASPPCNKNQYEVGLCYSAAIFDMGLKSPTLSISQLGLGNHHPASMHHVSVQTFGSATLQHHYPAAVFSMELGSLPLQQHLLRVLAPQMEGHHRCVGQYIAPLLSRLSRLRYLVCWGMCSIFSTTK